MCRLTFAVKEGQCRSQIASNERGFPLGEVDPLLYPGQKLAAFDLLEHQIEPLIVLEHFQQLYDVGMTVTMMERFNLGTDY